MRGKKRASGSASVGAEPEADDLGLKLGPGNDGLALADGYKFGSKRRSWREVENGTCVLVLDSDDDDVDDSDAMGEVSEGMNEVLEVVVRDVDRNDKAIVSRDDDGATGEEILIEGCDREPDGEEPTNEMIVDEDVVFVSEISSIDSEFSDVQYQKLKNILEQTKVKTQMIASQVYDFKAKISEKFKAIGNSRKLNKKRQNNKQSGRRHSKRKRQSKGLIEEEKIEDQMNMQLVQYSGTAEKENESINEDLLAEQKKMLPDFCGVLKDYQVDGVKWLISLWMTGSNGILADQMGLGKTIQTLALISHLLSQKVSGYFLVVAPVSTIQNWEREANKWIPNHPVIIYHGTPPERSQIRRSKMPLKRFPLSPIVITSYEIAIKDSKLLKRYFWKYMVVDEGHRLKNHSCRLFKVLKRQNVETILLLTGTPLQNNLTELWSLLNFIFPNMFSSQKEFVSWFKFAEIRKTNENSPTKEAYKSIISKLHDILRPFVLRRLKNDVLNCLPKKKEIVLFARMTPDQETFYKTVKEKTFFDPESKINPDFNIDKNKTTLAYQLMQLRKVCNHPFLFSSEFFNENFPSVDQLKAQCGKFHLFCRIMEVLQKKRHRVLIFCQMTRVLDIIEHYLDTKKIRNFRIDGNVKWSTRIELMDDFNQRSSFCVFLLSTRAGGLGINLTSADTVILYDSDWNPHVDMQAMDRCHRIGQTKPVHVYRLITSNSVEQYICQVAMRKLKLEHTVLERGKFKQVYQSIEDLIQDDWNDEYLDAMLDKRKSLMNEGEDEWIFSEPISEKNLLLLVNRSDMMMNGSNPFATPSAPKSFLPPKGVGWQVLEERNEKGILSAIR